MFFPFVNMVDIQRYSRTRDSVGQTVDTYTIVAANVKCLYSPTTGGRFMDPQYVFNERGVIYFTPDVNIKEGDRLVNLRNSTGTLLEPGPLLVRSVQKVSNHLTGGTHHFRCELEGITK
jgi:hypothetical protein